MNPILFNKAAFYSCTIMASTLQHSLPLKTKERKRDTKRGQYWFVFCLITFINLGPVVSTVSVCQCVNISKHGRHFINTATRIYTATWKHEQADSARLYFTDCSNMYLLPISRGYSVQTLESSLPQENKLAIQTTGNHVMHQ